MEHTILENVVNTLNNEFKPKSIFLYGSKATNSSNLKSDYEIGVIFDDYKYITRSQIKEFINTTGFSIFPFKLSEILSYAIDTPFNKNIYMKTLIEGGAKTLVGEKIIENLTPPKIRKIDLISDANFNLGYALACVQVAKTRNLELANEFFYKSCFFALRNLIFSETKKLEINYRDIYLASKKIPLLDDYKELINIAYDLRCEKIKIIDEKFYFKNISFINKYIIPKLK